MGQVEAAGELWFSPITGHCFAVPALLNSRSAARDVLLQAGVDREPAGSGGLRGTVAPLPGSQSRP